MVKPTYEIKTYGKHNKRVIFLVGGWGSPQWMMWPASKLLELSGFRCITYSLNYKILTPDINKSISQLMLAKQNIINQINQLRKKGYQDFTIFGNSLGALISLLVAGDSIHIKKIIFNTPGIDFAKSLWKWDRVLPEFKQELIKSYPTLELLKKAVAPIDPLQNLSKIVNRDLLVYISANDEIVSCPETEIKKALSRHRARSKLIVNRRFGHVITLMINLINAPEYLRFLND